MSSKQEREKHASPFLGRGAQNKHERILELLHIERNALELVLGQPNALGIGMLIRRHIGDLRASIPKALNVLNDVRRTRVSDSERGRGSDAPSPRSCKSRTEGRLADVDSCVLVGEISCSRSGDVLRSGSFLSLVASLLSPSLPLVLW